MEKKNYSKYTLYTDRFPFLIVAIIFAMTIIFVFQFSRQYPLSFLSGSTATTQDIAGSEFPILVASPLHNQVFDFTNKNLSVPIEIKSKKIERLNYKLNVVINDKETIKTFSEPPYKYDWYPLDSGEYTIVANLVDNVNNTISSSNKVQFIVNYKAPTDTSESMPEAISKATEDTVINGIAPTINLKIFDGPTYVGDDICYYRVVAIVTGDPVPAVSFSKDDSGGAWGPLKAQVNLTRNTPNYTLSAIARNSAGEAMSGITLNWR